MYNDKRVKAYHDSVVDSLAVYLNGVGCRNILFPDRVDGSNTKPDLHIPGVAVIEVKVIKPGAKDDECDQKAVLDLKTKRRYKLGGRINGRAREDDIRQATKQLRAVNESVKILVLASPLNFIPSNRHLLEELHGNQYVDYYRMGLSVTSTPPYVKSHSAAKLRERNGIGAILVTRGIDFNIHNTKLYRVSAYEPAIYGKLTTNQIGDFWDYKRGVLL